MIDNNTTASNNLSNNQVASGNFSQNTLVNFKTDFSGLEKTISLLIPSLRNALVERYRAETFCKIGMKANEIIDILRIETKPIPPKAALPLFEKASLEHEEDMYEMWAKLLVAASDEYNSIHIQYAEILSKMGSKEAKLLLDMYKFQANNISFRACGGNMDSYTQGLEYFNSAREIYKHVEIRGMHTMKEIEEIVTIPKSIRIKLKHFLKKLTAQAEKNFRGYALKIYDLSEKYNIEENKATLRALCELGLVKYYSATYPIITNFGCELIEELEKYNIEAN